MKRKDGGKRREKQNIGRLKGETVAELGRAGARSTISTLAHPCGDFRVPRLILSHLTANLGVWFYLQELCCAVSL